MSQEEHEDAIRHLVNNKPQDNYGGLTFNEISRLTFEMYTPQSPLQIKRKLSDETLDQMPFFRLTEEFMKIILRDGSIKLTPLGALPKKVLVELYSHRLILEELVEDGLYKLSREIDSASLTTVHLNTTLSRLVRKANGKLLLTKEGKKLLTPDARNALFLKVLFTFTELTPWGTTDGYPSLPVGNLGWGFTIFMLLREGAIPHEARYYADKYLHAFPNLVNAYPPDPFRSNEDLLISCYSLRTFERFLEWWGFATTDAHGFRLDRHLKIFTAAEILKEVFEFEEL